jgi:hypothetical protein
MKTIIIMLSAVFVVSVLPCGGAEFSFGSASGAPGESVSLPVQLSGAYQLTGFTFQFEYDNDTLSYEGASLGSAAQANSIDEIDSSIINEQVVAIEAQSSQNVGDLGDGNGTVAKLRFTISPAAQPGTSTKVSFTGPATFQNGYTSNPTANTSGSGTISVTAPATPVPTGTPPEVSLRMESAEVLTYGEAPVVHYRVNENDWGGYSSDAYLGVSVPYGQFFYLDSHGDLTTKRRAVIPNMTIRNRSGDVGFGPLPFNAPPGRYTFYCVLTYVGTNPLQSRNRISNLAKTQFDLVPPAP